MWSGLSTYAPAWVKQDPTRFPRSVIFDRNAGNRQKTVDVVSVFGKASQEADANALRELMLHLRQIDDKHSTVIMVQVENEVGLLGDSRDRSQVADEALHSRVPAELISLLRDDWLLLNDEFRSHFPKDGLGLQENMLWADLPCDPMFRDEIFMAYHYAKYVDSVAAAAKSVYPLPLYTNAWQKFDGGDTRTITASTVAGGVSPGDYPCGGPVSGVIDIWRAVAPSLDFVAPDIYLNDYVQCCSDYRHRKQPLFIPEQRRDEYGAIRMWSALGSYQCLGVAPFGVDTIPAEENAFTKHYALLKKVSKYVLDAQLRENSSVGFFFDEIGSDGHDSSQPAFLRLDKWHLKVERAVVYGRPAPGCGLVIDLGKDQFLLVGWGFRVSFSSTNPEAYFTGLLKFEEKDVDATGMRTVRLLNGDETTSGRYAVMPSEKPDYGAFPISITIPARTGMALCQPYALTD